MKEMTRITTLMLIITLVILNLYVFAESFSTIGRVTTGINTLLFTAALTQLRKNERN